MGVGSYHQRDQAQAAAAGGEVAGVASQPQATGVVSGQARAAAERLLSVAKEVREVRLRGARDVVTADVEGDLRVVEDSLRAVAERIEQAAKGVLSAGNRLPGATEPFPSKSLTDIQSLLKLDRYPEHKKAWEEWHRRCEVLHSRVSRTEARSADVTNHIFNIIGWYAVFLGVVLTAVSQLTQTASNVPVCGKIWFPILLTGFGTVVTICGITYKYRTLKSLEVAIQSEIGISKELQRRILTLESKGPKNFDFLADAKDPKKFPPKTFWVDKIFVILSLIAFAAVFVLSYFVILCDTWTVRRWDNGIHG